MKRPAPQAPRKRPKTLRDEARRAIARCAGWNARLAARHITQFIEREMAGSGIGLAQFGLLALIAAAEDDTLGALAERAGLEQSSLSRNLRLLERDGLVEIATVEADQRRRAVWLTETGARRLEAAMPRWQQAQARLARLMSPELPRRLAQASRSLVES